MYKIRLVKCPHCGKECKPQGIGSHIWRMHTEKGRQVTKDANLKAQEAHRRNPSTFKGRKHTPEAKEKISKARVEVLNNRRYFSKPEIYKGIQLDSSYESFVARELDANKIKWTRPKSLRYNDGKQIRRYVPDFYLVDYDVYLDPKNDWLIIKDEVKISLAREQNSVKIIVLNSKSLTWSSIKKLINALDTG